MKILLVEDSKPIRRENETALHNAGYEVICAVDGESAVRFAQDQKPDLILLDMILPRMSGPEVLRHLKSDPLTAEIPVVVLSSLSEKNREKPSPPGFTLARRSIQDGPSTTRSSAPNFEGRSKTAVTGTTNWQSPLRNTPNQICTNGQTATFGIAVLVSLFPKTGDEQ